MSRWAAGIEYLGTAYSGWQAQQHALGVQQRVEEALGAVADAPISVTVAGRTDAGVHALGQVVHFDATAERDSRAWLFGANTHLPGDISLHWVKPVPDEFHARYSPLLRRYSYLVLNRRARSGLYLNRMAWEKQPLDVGAMQQAGQALLGTHDFSAFRSSQCQAHNAIRTVQSLEIEAMAQGMRIDIAANAFLHHMVRNIAGTLLAIGRGDRPVAWMAKVLDSRDRRQGGVTAEACGLYFRGPEYPQQFAIPDPPPIRFL